jgi:hypothetical protein
LQCSFQCCFRFVFFHLTHLEIIVHKSLDVRLVSGCKKIQRIFAFHFYLIFIWLNSLSMLNSLIRMTSHIYRVWNRWLSEATKDVHALMLKLLQ